MGGVMPGWPRTQRLINERSSPLPEGRTLTDKGCNLEHATLPHARATETAQEDRHE